MTYQMPDTLMGPPPGLEGLPMMDNQPIMDPVSKPRHNLLKTNNNNQPTTTFNANSEEFVPQSDIQMNGKTTVQLRNVPKDYDSSILCQLLDHHGFSGKYNFIIIPEHAQYRNMNRGFAFINLINEVTVDDFMKKFCGLPLQGGAMLTVCDVQMANVQGYEENMRANGRRQGIRVFKCPDGVEVPINSCFTPDGKLTLPGLGKTGGTIRHNNYM